MAATTVPEKTSRRHPGRRPAGPRSTAAGSGMSRRLRGNIQAYGFLVGALLCFGFFSWYPMVREFVMSFQRTRRGVTTWVGLRNFKTVYHDPYFWTAWRNTALFTLYALVIGFAVPFLVAILLNELRHARAYLRVLVYLPVMLPPVAGALLFKYFYDPEYGLFNHILKAVHLPTSQWLDSPHTALISVVIAATWMSMGSATLIYLAALQNIPGELYEAADLDGAGLLRKIWHVTVPQTRLVLSLMLLLQVVATMQEFTNVFLMAGGNGPQNSTTTVVYMIYQYGYHYDNFNGAAVLGLFLMLVLICFSGLYTRLSRNSD
ncbi:carbohydrate ABC transporter permease [Actinacidiphila yeochonensis]|uniref:carbohydrate ABC transporter permease n=1 Tax=Actinacidiphila yeochonensis TaxID=89050 RepID=UPI0005617153|nr:sugar ABC transporter permease [Actinacidiphila yeochonensis]